MQSRQRKNKYSKGLMRFIHSQTQNRQRLTNAVVGAIKNSIHAHGPIDFKSNSINSVRKRVNGSLKEYVIVRRPSIVLKEFFLCGNKRISSQCKANRNYKEK